MVALDLVSKRAGWVKLRQGKKGADVDLGYAVSRQHLVIQTNGAVA